MIIITENGPRSFYNPTSATPPAILRAEREWRNAWNESAETHNKLISTAQTYYGRWLDVAMLPMIAADSVKIPS
jgi:hypothetical protein